MRARDPVAFSILAGDDRPPVRTRRRLAALVVLASTFALLLVVFQLLIFVGLSWPHREPAGSPEWGINFSCNQAEYLLLEDPSLGPAGYVDDARPGRVEWCAATLERLLTGLGATRVRLSVEWDQVEPREGVYDFALLDAQLATAERAGASVLLSVGMKAQRHPEYYIPAWALAKPEGLSGARADGAEVSRDPVLRAAALRVVAVVVAHAANSRVVEGWLAENEPYLGSPRAHRWRLDRDYVREVVAAIHANDPRTRPVVINHAEKLVFDQRWRRALEDADILAGSIYPFRIWNVPWGKHVQSILELGPLTPNYAERGRDARAIGKQYWLTEMQAEPWGDPDIRLNTPEHPARDLTPGRFRKNLDYARRTGASRVYLWGAEWWLFQRERYGDDRWWNMGREALSER